MALGCGANLIKILLFLFNFVFVLAGIALMVFGGMALFTINSVEDFVKDIQSVNTFWVIVVVIGAFVFIFAFLGCYGAICESQCSLMLYSICIVIATIASIVIAVFAFKSITPIEKAADELWGQFWQNRVNGTQKVIDEIQKGLKCCGNTGTFDYTLIPQSCCPKDIQKCDKEHAYSIGCKDQIQSSIGTYGKWIGYGSVILAIIEVITVSSICYLRTRIEYEQFV